MILTTTSSSTNGTIYWATCGIDEIQKPQMTATEWREMRVFDHHEHMAAQLSFPITLAYCISMIVVAGFLLIWMNICANERRNVDDNRTRIELAKLDEADSEEQ